MKIWSPTEDGAVPPDIGGKALGLCRLRSAGFPVPDFCVILPHSGPWVEAEWQAFREAHVGPADTWAVRSSATAEDGTRASFAGQFLTRLGVPSVEVGRAVTEVRASSRAGRVAAYEASQGIATGGEVAVVVQRMLDPAWSGVAFSADPATGDRQTVVVSAVEGVGEGLVSGAVEGQTFRIGPESPAPVEPPWVSAVADLARRVERLFGRPQDLEWALEGDQLFLLQARPITTLGQVAEPRGEQTIFDSSNIAESYAGVTTPMTFSFARHVYEAVYRQFCRALAVPSKRLEDNADLFPRMLGFLEGRIYYNLINWYRLIALLPGFSLNYRWMEQMMGVGESLPPELLTRLQKESLRPRGRDYWAIGKAGMKMFWEFARLGRNMRRFEARLVDALVAPSIPWEAMELSDLGREFRALERNLITRWDTPLINDLFTMIFFGAFRGACERWIDPEARHLPGALVAGKTPLASAEPARQIRRMAGLVSAHRSLRTYLESIANGSTPPPSFAEWPDFEFLWDDYLERFGDRCMQELKLERPSLREDVRPLVAGVLQAAASGQRESAETPVDGADEAVVEKSLRKHWLRRLVFRWLRRRARFHVTAREVLRLERTRVFGRARRILREMGHRLWIAGRLDDPENIFFLSFEEVLGFIEGTAVTTDLRALAELRRKAHNCYLEKDPPTRISTKGAVHLGNRFEGAPKPASEKVVRAWSGLPCFPGIVRGRVRFVQDPARGHLKPGEILLAQRTDPGWVLLFPAAAGLIVEHGNALSHAAIVARELGLPTVISLAGITKELADGAEVELDGAAGTVRLLRESEEDRA